MSDDQALESVHRVISLLRTLPLFNGKWFGVNEVARRWDKAPSTLASIAEVEELAGKE